MGRAGREQLQQKGGARAALPCRKDGGSLGGRDKSERGKKPAGSESSALLYPSLPPPPAPKNTHQRPGTYLVPAPWRTPPATASVTRQPSAAPEGGPEGLGVAGGQGPPPQWLKRSRSGDAAPQSCERPFFFGGGVLQHSPAAGKAQDLDGEGGFGGTELAGEAPRGWDKPWGSTTSPPGGWKRWRDPPPKRGKEPETQRGGDSPGCPAVPLGCWASPRCLFAGGRRRLPKSGLTSFALVLITK